MCDSRSERSSNEFQRVAELFEAARHIPGEHRETFLQAKFESTDIIHQVRQLLELHDEEGCQLDSPIVANIPLVRNEMASNDSLSLPDRIGRFRVLRLIGAGGMGTVYLAEQDNPRRQVAVKIVRPGLTSRELQRRFELEAAVLGRLQHPGIAQIFEAGLYDDSGPRGGNLFFAMEFVDCVPLNEHVRRQKLGVEDRLRIFIHVCDAVHHAHQRGVIHRDLKPGNILVAISGQPKILDFGVARATDFDVQATTLFTNVGQLIGTIPYMSPEQALGHSHDVDTRSDVYALGVMLYELLADRLPYDLSAATIMTAAKLIAEIDPHPLSAVNKSYRGDLNTIVLKALAKKPAERYGSAAEFAADIQRFLTHDPIAARPQTTWYQIRKFARRHRGLVGGVAAVFVVLLAGVAATAWQASRVAWQRDYAAEQALRANETSSLLSRMIKAATPEHARGTEPTIRQMLAETSRELRTDDSIHPTVAADTHRILAESYSSLGHFDVAEQHAQQAAALHTELHGLNSIDVINDQLTLANVLSLQDRDQEAIALSSDALKRARRYFSPMHEIVIESARVHVVALGRTPQPDMAEVVRLFRENYLLSLETFGPRDSVTLRAQLNLGKALVDIDEFEEAERLLREVCQLRREYFGEDHPDTLVVMDNIATLHVRKGDFPGAVKLGSELVALANRVLGQDHPRTITYRLNLARYETQAGQVEESERTSRTNLESAIRRLGPLHEDTLAIRGMVIHALLMNGKTTEAEPLVIEQHQLCLQEFGSGHAYTVKAATLMFDLAEAQQDVKKMRQWAAQLQGTEWEKPAQEMIRQMEEKLAPIAMKNTAGD